MTRKTASQMRVQPEDGTVRIAYKLAEGLLLAPFSVIQFKILHAIIRLSYGWNEPQVRASQSQLAACCGGLDAENGSFRRAYDELVEEGVIVVVEPKIGRRAALLRINKYPDTWGRFSVDPAKLKTLFGSRPDSGKPSPRGRTKTRRSPSPRGQSTPSIETERDSVVRPKPGAVIRPPEAGQVFLSVPQGTDRPHASISSDNELQGWKDSSKKDTIDTSTTTPPRAREAPDPPENGTPPNGAPAVPLGAAVSTAFDAFLETQVRAQFPPEFFPRIEAFVLRRLPHTHASWWKEMLACRVFAEPVDIASVCDDDGTLSVPIGSAKVFRQFVRGAMNERRGIGVSTGPPPPRSGGVSGGGARHDETIDKWLLREEAKDDGE